MKISEVKSRETGLTEEMQENLEGFYVTFV